MSKYFIDLIERVAATAIFAALGVYTVGGGLDNAKKAGVVGIAAGLSVIKGWLAKFVGNNDSASLTTTV